MTFLTILGDIMQFWIVQEGETGKEIPESSRLDFLEKVSAISLYQMQKTTPPGRWIEEV